MEAIATKQSILGQQRPPAGPIKTLICAGMILGVGAVSGTKSAVELMIQKRDQVLLEAVSNRVNGKSFALDTKEQRAKTARDMTRDDLVNALYVLSVRNQQLEGTLENINLMTSKE